MVKHQPTVLLALLGAFFAYPCSAFSLAPLARTTTRPTATRRSQPTYPGFARTLLYSQGLDSTTAAPTANQDDGKDGALEEEQLWYKVPEDAVIQIRPRAMRRLNELRQQQQQPDIWLRMGVKSGGCSGMSYVMDFCDPDDVTDDDVVDRYESEKVQCVVDPKSILYLYGLELDYSTELIGGGFKFFNPNAEESCGCGSSFGI